ncbi:mRNA-decapping enzyme 1B-like [Ptychodera flava]|uniref:mRNA-decapping enzyme 1B-like n=1 Tax=Ptychodera flava TaxID=63121 RepID=UPI00396AA88E
MAAASAAGRMNLAALQQQDPYITHIVDTATQVALYSFNPGANEWEKTNVEGTLFVYARSASPSNGYTIMNRLSMENLTEPITKDLEFQVNDPFLLYRNTKGASIYGIWFYDKDECTRIGDIMHRMTISAGQEDTESNTSSIDGNSTTGSEKSNPIDIMQMLSKAQSDYNKGSGDSLKSSSDTGSVSSGSVAALQHEGKTKTDIMSMLSKAQDEYTKKAQQTPKKEEPKHMTEVPAANTMVTASNIVKPVPVKADSTSPKRTDRHTAEVPYSGAQNPPQQWKQTKRKTQTEQYRSHQETQNPLPPAHVKNVTGASAREGTTHDQISGVGLNKVVAGVCLRGYFPILVPPVYKLLNKK